MKRLLLLIPFFPLLVSAQKKPLDHSVYDGWQSIGERLISNDGKWVVYTVTPQEGDAELYIQSTQNLGDKRQIARGYNALITEDSKYVVFKIKPLYKETREARIKKRLADAMPKDSFAIIELGKEGVLKVAKVRSYKTPEKGAGWVAFSKEREAVPTRAGAAPLQRTVDSLRLKIDSLTQLVTQLKNTKSGSRDGEDADGDPVPALSAVEGTDLVLRNLLTGRDRTFKNVSDYVFNRNGGKLVIRFTKAVRDSNSTAGVAVVDLATGRADTVLRGGNDFRSFAFTEDGASLAFVAERDTTKALQKFYSLYLYRSGTDTAELIVHKGTAGMQLGMKVSEAAAVSFSKTGRRILFGTAVIPPPKDTSIVEFETAKLDVWNYKDDYLQSVQLFNLQTELKRSYLAVYDVAKQQMVQIGTPGLPTVIATAEGDGKTFIAITDTGRRIQSQWEGSTRKDIYAVDAATGEKTLVKKAHDGPVYPSATGRYILMYDLKAKNYLAWDARTENAAGRGAALKNITAKIKVPLYNEENDVPDDPTPYGVMGWHEGDSAVYVYDKYDVWKVDPKGVDAPMEATRFHKSTGRSLKRTYRYLRVNNDERFVTSGQEWFLRMVDEQTKSSVLMSWTPSQFAPDIAFITNGFSKNYPNLFKAKQATTFVYTEEDYSSSNLILAPYGTEKQTLSGWHSGGLPDTMLTHLNLQQSLYNWGTAELFKWKTFDGKSSEGILYKPEDFDPKKKYPMITYFYEKLSDGLYQYMAPSPTPSRLNIPFFVSRCYLVFAPDITYTKGHPGKDAYNYIVSGVKALAKNSWVDSTKLGLQGQSWGGYQVAYLITATNMFKAAWAGAPVVNMFSAYGGIRWESGSNRQFQYERGQTRIGATIWERPDLYIENSPLFHLPKVKTPLVIMSNDADGAVPWYQGIEFFTAMRRLGKPVWLLNYNGEAHNLVERRNRKDIQVKEQEYFDWLLKGAAPPKWISEGVPAVRKNL